MDHHNPSVCTGLCRRGLQLFQSFPNGISIGGNGDDLQPHWKSWRKSKWISSGDKNSQLSLLALKQSTSTTASAEHSLPFRKPAPIYVSFPLRFIIFCSQSLHLIKDGMVMFIVPSRRTRWRRDSPSTAKKGSLGIKQRTLTCHVYLVGPERPEPSLKEKVNINA